MNIFLFWVIIITIVLGGYLYYIYRRSPKGFRFQVKLTIIFILLVLVPAIPLTSFVSGLLTRGVEMFLLPGVGESLLSSLEVIKLQLEERGESFLNTYPSMDQMNADLAEKNNIVYYAILQRTNKSPAINRLFASQEMLIQKSPAMDPEVFDAILAREIKSNLFTVDGENICEVYQVAGDQQIKVVACKIHPKIVAAKDRITESIRVYNSLSLIKNSVVEGQLIWGFSTLFIILLALIAIYAAKILSRGISGPIQELVVGMQRVAEGNLASPVRIKAKDELKFLVDSFNKMAEDLKTSQEKLIRAERLAAWQEVARRVSHEIRNALTPIQLSIRRLWNRLGSDDKIVKDNSLLTIQEEVESLRRISEEFSEFARMPQIDPKKEDLNKVIRDLIAFIEAEPGTTQIKLSLDENLPPVYIDRIQMRRALHNLIKNSIEAIDGDRPVHFIHITTAQIKDGKRTVKIEISDNGKGMTPEVLAKIFEPNFTTKRRGMGLGLSIVKRIIEDHGGEIHFESTPGKGTRVEILL